MAAITLGMCTNASYVDTAQSAARWQDSLPKKGEIVSDFYMLLLLICLVICEHN